MCRKNPQQCDDGIELTEYAVSHGAKKKRQVGSHVILELPNGKYESIPNHRHPLGKGLKCKIIKHLAAAGISLMLILPIIQALTG